MRSYKQIYGRKSRTVIEDSIAKSRIIAQSIPPLKIHSHEQVRCLEAGSALGAFLISFAMVECVLLSLYATGMHGKDPDKETVLKSLAECEDEKKRFRDVLLALKRRKILRESERKALDHYYKQYRIPFSHGLLSRGVFENKFYREFFSLLSHDSADYRMVADWRETEEVIEGCIYIENEILSIIIDIINRNIYVD